MSGVPEKPVNRSKALPFRDLVQYLLQPLQDYTRRPGIKGRSGAVAPAELKRAAIAKFVARWRKEVGDDVFPVFRLLMPERDKDRAMYRIKEANMAKLFIKILGISPASEDAISIEKWKIPSARGAAGDFPGRLYEVLRIRAAVSDWGDMSIDEVNEGLEKLALCSKESQQLPIMSHFYYHMSAQELRWLCCIILRSMKIGATERTFFDVWHPDASKLFNKSSSLSRVCWELYQHDYRLPDVEKDISIFSCFQPQLAGFRKNNLEDLVKKMPGEMFYIEEKLDGERIQLHKKGDSFKYWSRKAKDYTYLYGASYGSESNQEGGGLSKHLRNAFDKRVKSIVLDGEMITWNDKFDAPVGFGTLKSAAKTEKSGTSTSLDGHPFYCVFDILYLNGKCLTAYSLRERRKVLEGVITSNPRRIEVVPIQEATRASEIESRLRECVATASEGLVVKDPDSAYIPNDRNESWIKVKPEYMSEFGENLDLLVIGGYWGEGKRGNTLGSFLCGLREDDPDSDDPIPKFKTFARVGGGFNGPDYAQIAEITQGKWKKFDKRYPQNEFYTFAFSRNGVIQEFPDMWIAPQDSFVVQVKAASSAPSDSFATKVTLRFPRFELIRDDKDWTTATSLREFISMQQTALTQKQDTEMKAHIRRKKAVKSRSKAPTILGAETIDTSPSQNKADLFKDMDFYVLSESRSFKQSRVDLESLIKSHGGNIVFHEGPPQHIPPSPTLAPKKLTASQKRKRDTAELDANPALQKEVFVIAERKVVKAASLVNRDSHDIMLPSWILQSIHVGHVLAKEPRFMFHTTPTTASVMIDSVDIYGDSYVNAIDVDGLKELIGKMLDIEIDDELESDMAALKAEMQELGEFPLWLFSRCQALFDSKDEKGDTSLSDSTTDMAQQIWRVGSGQIVEDIHDHALSHIVVDPRNRNRLKKLRSAASLKDKVPRLVSPDWILESWEAGTVLSEARYQIV